jgi:sterol 24-C-methyltransferase
MSSFALEREDTARDAAFNQALHGQSAKARGGLAAMRGKNAAAQKTAVDEYFKHWDNKGHLDETDADREVRQHKQWLNPTKLIRDRHGDRNMLP